MTDFITINDRCVGPGFPVYIVAEISANHNQNFDRAVRLVEAAKQAGADAIKVQTYTPDTMTIDCDSEPFQIRGTLWDGRTLYDLYREAYTPWDWQPRLKQIADELGIVFFSTPFDITAVDFLEEMGVPMYKIASFENVDLPLLRKVAETGRPIIMSTGMATLGEIDEAVRVIRGTSAAQLALLECVSAYPAQPEEMNLRTISNLSKVFHLPVGLSDHTLGTAVPVAAVALGACIVEKHFTLSRDIPGPDSAFSLEPCEFREMVQSIRVVERALGQVCYDITEHEFASRILRRSLFVVQDVKAGEMFTAKNVRSIRPGHGLHPRYLEEVVGRHASRDIERGTPLAWNLVR
jgi:pseudaminic acid synthase